MGAHRAGFGLFWLTNEHFFTFLFHFSTPVPGTGVTEKKTGKAGKLNRPTQSRKKSLEIKERFFVASQNPFFCQFEKHASSKMVGTSEMAQMQLSDVPFR